jgi:hypothetical protein
MGNSRFGPVSAPHSSRSCNDESAPTETADTSKDSLAILAYLSQEIIGRMGKDFLGKVPLNLTERFCMTTVERNDPTAELLYKLVTNFMTAYANAETSDEALKAFDFLDYLADKDV